ncbi:hypothetical protein RJT34_22659 [Clitoria ternatea]|uniref:Uncharacterized protein n=1 Tax=Clitoria ternatea TaxID=43366 RepID=A0AAN9IGH7_CLITE
MNKLKKLRAEATAAITENLIQGKRNILKANVVDLKFKGKDMSKIPLKDTSEGEASSPDDMLEALRVKAVESDKRMEEAL